MDTCGGIEAVPVDIVAMAESGTDRSVGVVDVGRVREGLAGRIDAGEAAVAEAMAVMPTHRAVAL